MSSRPILAAIALSFTVGAAFAGEATEFAVPSSSAARADVAATAAAQPARRNEAFGSVAPAQAGARDRAAVRAEGRAATKSAATDRTAAYFGV